MSEAPSKESMEPQPSDEGSAASAPALEAEHLLRAVVGKVITNNISVQVHVGEILAVTGPSGSGKSSFLTAHELAKELDYVSLITHLRPQLKHTAILGDHFWTRQGWRRSQQRRSDGWLQWRRRHERCPAAPVDE
jgi:ABC-type molybdenum transport system ATPase subunit/photorepair protein PhrA